MNSSSNTFLDAPFTESLTANALSIAVIGPDDKLRKAAVAALVGCHDGRVREFSSYPPSLDDLPHLLDQHHDIVLIEMDSNPEYALDLVEGICSSGASTVMVYSKETDPELSDPDLLMRCMRAGAREFLSMPFANNSMAEALVRAAARRAPVRAAKKTSGRLLVFCGAKGGAGVTAVACNFAMALARESSETTLLIDLDLPLGDAALTLGINAEYSTTDALQNFNRLDSSFLSKLLTKHSSGMSVLAAPGTISPYRPVNDAIDRLLTLARHDFENIVIDVGSKLDPVITAATFREATSVYLITQAGIPELRNANRLISQYFSTDGPRLEIVLNRFESRGTKFSDEDIRKALTRQATWKIPNDYGAVRKMQDTAAPLALTDSAIAWQIGQMARSACGLPELPPKKKGFSLKGLGKSTSPKSSNSDESPGILRLGLITDQGTDSAPDSAARSSASQGSDLSRFGDVERESYDVEGAFEQQGEAETRTYNGDTYVRGADGRWYPKDILPGDTDEETPTIEWSTLDSIPYGTALSTDQFNASSSVPGRFIYTPSEGYVLPAGTHTLWVTFIPGDTSRNTTLQASVALTVTKAMPILSWPRPSAISCGIALGAGQLNAMASVPGTFEYIPGDGDVPNVGVQSLLVAFTPTDTANYATAQAEVPLTVTKAATTITWPAPAAISHGTVLSSAQLCATASDPGEFVYTPAEGSVLAAGRHTLSATFIPTDSANHTAGQAEVLITVSKAMPTIKWSAPHAISYGTPLSVEVLNAKSSVAGTFVYIPGEGAVLAAGRHTPVAIFTPADPANYSAAQAAVSLTVSKAVPTITWPTTETIAYGTPLGASELDASASVPGTFAYTPVMGDILTEGRHSLAVVFTPIDATNFTNAQASVELNVTKATPIAITWPASAAIGYGVPLSADQLNATASVAGVFDYSPSEGNILSAGRHTLSVTFTPADSNFPPTKGTVELSVTKSKPAITWPTPRAIPHGIALSSGQLNSVASVHGTFVYDPAEGVVPNAGKQKLLTTFIPTDSANFERVQAEVSLTVTKLTPTILWSSPDAINYGTALSATQLNAAASTPGSFVYTPSSGTVLPAGTQTLSAGFIPTDFKNYTAAQATVSVVVNELSSMAYLTTPSPDPDVSDSLPAIQPHDVGPVGQRQSVEQNNESRALPMGKGLSTGTQLSSGMSDKSDQANASRAISEVGNASHRESEPETRTYKGSVYKKGPDGQWHLQQK